MRQPILQVDRLERIANQSVNRGALVDDGWTLEVWRRVRSRRHDADPRLSYSQKLKSYKQIVSMRSLQIVISLLYQKTIPKELFKNYQSEP